MSSPPLFRVVCIDDCPIPINPPEPYRYELFSFPNGFIQRGTIYLVTDSIPASNGHPGYRLLDLPICYHHREVSWDGSRFRRLRESNFPSSQISEKEALLEAVEHECKATSLTDFSR